MRSEVRFPEWFHFFFGVPFFFRLFLLGNVYVFTTGYLNLVDSNYTVRYCTTYEYVFVHNCHVFLLLLCVLLFCCCCSCSAAASCCCSSSYAGLRNLLLRFIASDSSQYFLSLHSNTMFLMYPLAVQLSHVQPRYTYNPTGIIHNIIHPRKLRACAEPRQAAAHRGEAHLVYRYTS